MRWYVGVLTLALRAMILKGASGGLIEDACCEGCEEVCPTTPKVSALGPHGEDIAKAAKVFADAANATWTYSLFFNWGKMQLGKEQRRDYRLDIVRGWKRFFEDAAAAVDDQPQPFAGRECGLLPGELRKFTAENYTYPNAPRISVTLNALARELDAIENKLRNNEEVTPTDAYSGIKKVCATFGWSLSTHVTYRTDSEFLEPARTLIGRDCRNGAAKEGSVEKAMMETMISYAKIHNFPETNDNRCLQIFVAHYTHLSAQAVELLQRSLDTYMYTYHAFCTPFVSTNNPKPQRDSARMLEVLGTGLRLLRRLALDNTVPWSCEAHTTPMPPCVDPSSIAGSAKTTLAVGPSNRPGSSENRTVTTVTDPPTSVEELKAWLKKANEVANKAINAVTRNTATNRLENRIKELLPAVTAALNTNLTDKYEKVWGKVIGFHSVAHLAYGGTGRSCINPNPDSVHGTHEHVTYFAQPYAKDYDYELVAAKQTKLFANGQNILDKTFSSSLDVVCETAASALKDELGLSVEKMASAFVVVTCAYEFVWYELGYRYFPAASSTSPYTLTIRQNNVYSANCGQIVLFP